MGLGDATGLRAVTSAGAMLMANQAPIRHPGPERQSMDRRQFFGDSVSGTIIRLVLLSIVVGIVFSALGINLFNIVERLQQLARNIINLGFDAFHWAFQYFLL